MKKTVAPFHRDLIKPYLRDKNLREKIKAGVKRLKVISQLVELREKHKVTQAELANRIGVSQPFIARLENDEESNLSLETLVKIVEALNGKLDIQIYAQRKAA
jgi:DNA-binding XRE family transcriptional regulator